MMNNDMDKVSNDIESEDVTSALHAILTTDKFSASPQMSAFLRYVVEQTLIGNTRRIKAFTVGIEALGKPASFDPQTDPSVRVLAKRLRSSLDAYYEQNPGTHIFIEMKPGSYIPKFLLRSEMKTQLSDTQTESHNDESSEQPTETEEAPYSEASTGASLETTEDSHQAGFKPLWQEYKSTSKVA